MSSISNWFKRSSSKFENISNVFQNDEELDRAFASVSNDFNSKELQIAQIEQRLHN